MIYLQCDVRVNSWILEKINNITVIEHVIEKCKKLNCSKIVAGIYECDENRELIDILREHGIEVIFSNNDDNSRFLEIVLKEKAEYCIRVCGDQVLLDVEETLRVFSEIKKRGLEFYYDEGNNCIIPDIVSIKCLKKYQEDIKKVEVYYRALIKNKEVSRYMPKSLMVMFNFRVNSREGFRVCSNVIEKSLNIYNLSSIIAFHLTKNDYIRASGLIGSWIIPSDFFYDDAGDVNPWLSKPCIDFLKPRLSKEMSVFEWGTGNSTLFWSKHVKEVVSVEYDEEWYKKLKEIVPKNVSLKYFKLEYDGAYCRAILEENQKYDIILIDGRDRVRCAKYAVNYLKDTGIIIWDNTDRESYQEGFEYLKKKGFKSITFSGLTYKFSGVELPTIIFYREKNILNL